MALLYQEIKQHSEDDDIQTIGNGSKEAIEIFFFPFASHSSHSPCSRLILLFPHMALGRERQFSFLLLPWLFGNNLYIKILGPRPTSSWVNQRKIGWLADKKYFLFQGVNE